MSTSLTGSWVRPVWNPFHSRMDHAAAILGRGRRSALGAGLPPRPFLEKKSPFLVFQAGWAESPFWGAMGKPTTPWLLEAGADPPMAVRTAKKKFLPLQGGFPQPQTDGWVKCQPAPPWLPEPRVCQVPFGLALGLKPHQGQSAKRADSYIPLPGKGLGKALRP